MAAAERDAAVLFEQNGTNVAARYKASIGDVELRSRAADYTRKEKLPRASPHRGADGDARRSRGMGCRRGTPKGHGATKVNFFNRRALAKMLGMPESDIEMMELDVGGGFGVRGEFYPEDFLIPFAARKSAGR